MFSDIWGDFSLTGEVTMTWSNPVPNGSNLSVQIKAYEVPEPGTLALLGAGLMGLAFTRRRRQPA